VPDYRVIPRFQCIDKVPVIRLAKAWVISFADESCGSKAFIHICVCVSVCVRTIETKRLKLQSSNLPWDSNRRPGSLFNVRSKGQGYMVKSAKTFKLKAFEWTA